MWVRRVKFRETMWSVWRYLANKKSEDQNSDSASSLLLLFTLPVIPNSGWLLNDSEILIPLVWDQNHRAVFLKQTQILFMQQDWEVTTLHDSVWHKLGPTNSLWQKHLDYTLIFAEFFIYFLISNISYISRRLLYFKTPCMWFAML